MKKFLLNIAIFSSIIILINSLASNFIDPYYGNEGYSVKYSHYIKNQNRYNTVVLGSSRMYRHFNPVIFDSFLADESFSTFNMGAQGTHNPEIYFLYNKLLDNIDDKSLKYAFIELQPLMEIDDRNLATVRNYYWLDIKYTFFALKYLLVSDYPGYVKSQQIGRFLQSYVLKLLDYKRYIMVTLPQRDTEALLGRNKDGIYFVEEHMRDAVHGKGNFMNRRNEFLRDTNQLSIKRESSTKKYSPENLKDGVNLVHLGMLEQILNHSKAKGIHLFFVIPPRLSDYREVRAIAQCFPAEQVIDVSDANKYPSLYRAAYTFDMGHLNEEGANRFTEYLARDVKCKLN